MVLSLAFIMAFIGAAISLLLGILIFGEVSDSLFATPSILSQEEVTTQINGTWQFREVEWASGIITRVNFATGSTYFQMSMTGTPEQATGLLMKNFPTAFLNNSYITVDHRGFGTEQGLSSAEARLRVLNGEYDRTLHVSAPSTFPPNTAFRTQEVSITQPFDVFLPNSFVRTLSTVLWQPTDLNDGFSTIVYMGRDFSSTREPTFRIHSINITDATTNATKAFYSFTGATITLLEFEGSPFPAFENGRGTVETTFGEQTVIVQEAVDNRGFDEFNNAKDTAWTVIGILPVALFFALFAIFSSFGNRE